MTDTVAFDPGIGQYFQDFNSFINEVYSQLMNFQSLQQKRIKFRQFNDKIYAGLENNIAFYQGCLLWAYYIKKKNKSNPKEIEGNIFVDMTKEEIDSYDYLLTANFIENYFDSYERDTQYYLGKKVLIPEKWKNILELYKNFLEQNKGFVKTKTTADIILPARLDKKIFEQDINNIIEQAIKTEDLKILLNNIEI